MLSSIIIGYWVNTTKILGNDYCYCFPGCDTINYSYLSNQAIFLHHQGVKTKNVNILRTKLAFKGEFPLDQMTGLSKTCLLLLKMLNRTGNKNKKLPFILLIRHQQNRFKNLQRASSKKITGCRTEL